MDRPRPERAEVPDDPDGSTGRGVAVGLPAHRQQPDDEPGEREAGHRDEGRRLAQQAWAVGHEAHDARHQDDHGEHQQDPQRSLDLRAQRRRPGPRPRDLVAALRIRPRGGAVGLLHGRRHRRPTGGSAATRRPPRPGRRRPRGPGPRRRPTGRPWGRRAGTARHCAARGRPGCPRVCAVRSTTPAENPPASTHASIATAGIARPRHAGRRSSGRSAGSGAPAGGPPARTSAARAARRTQITSRTSSDRACATNSPCTVVTSHGRVPAGSTVSTTQTATSAAPVSTSAIRGIQW